MQKFIYLVCAGTGRYDDAKDWNVKAFVDENEANEFVKMANKWADEFGNSRPFKRPDFDEYFSYDCLTGTIYGVEKIELV